MKGQVDLDGKPVTKNDSATKREETQIWKSVLQKTIRRGLTEKAMYAAFRLCNEQNGDILWRRLSIISVEDIGNLEGIIATEILKKQSRDFGYNSWDGRRCAVCAAKILSEVSKDRRADEFLELMDAFDKHNNDTELQLKKNELEAIPDEALDMHTTRGRKMKRGAKYWYDVSSETTNQKKEYSNWRAWWKPLMLRLVQDSKNAPGELAQPEGSSKD